MALGEDGKDIDYLTHKSTQARISCATSSERGTSSRFAGMLTSPRAETGHAVTAAFVATAISSARSICIRLPMVRGIECITRVQYLLPSGEPSPTPLLRQLW